MQLFAPLQGWRLWVSWLRLQSWLDAAKPPPGSDRKKTPPPLQSAGVGISEMRTVLELANKLKAAGLTDGVMLCQQLLDVMLGNAPKAKK
jgi:hypothetical protein